MEIKLIYIIIAAVAFVFAAGLIAGLVIAIVKMKKAMTKEQQAEATAEITKVLQSLIVGAETKLAPLAKFLATEAKKAGGIKKEVVYAEAIQYIQDHKLDIPGETVSSIIDTLVEFMNKKTPALEEVTAKEADEKSTN